MRAALDPECQELAGLLQTEAEVQRTEALRLVAEQPPAAVRQGISRLRQAAAVGRIRVSPAAYVVGTIYAIAADMRAREEEQEPTSEEILAWKEARRAQEGMRGRVRAGSAGQVERLAAAVRWKEVLEDVAVVVPEEVYFTWWAPLSGRFMGEREGVTYVEVPTRAHRDEMSSQGEVLDLVARRLARVLDVRFVVDVSSGGGGAGRDEAEKVGEKATDLERYAVSVLIEHGVKPGVARGLAGRFGVERVWEVILHSRTTAKNPGGFIRKALEEGWKWGDGSWHEALRRRARELSERARALLVEPEREIPMEMPDESQEDGKTARWEKALQARKDMDSEVREAKEEALERLKEGLGQKLGATVAKDFWGPARYLGEVSGRDIVALPTEVLTEWVESSGQLAAVEAVVREKGLPLAIELLAPPGELAYEQVFRQETEARSIDESTPPAAPGGTVVTGGGNPIERRDGEEMWRRICEAVRRRLEPIVWEDWLSGIEEGYRGIADGRVRVATRRLMWAAAFEHYFREEAAALGVELQMELLETEAAGT